MRRARALGAGVVLVLAGAVGGCGVGVDEAALVGEFVADDGTVVLDGDGTFRADAVPVAVLDDDSGGAATLAGTWEYLESPGFVYLTIDDVAGSDSSVTGVQLYVRDVDLLYLDPGRGGTLDFARRG